MSQMAAAQARTPVQSPQSQTSGVLQRKCCEGTRKKPILQRAATGPSPETVPPIVYEVLRSPGQPLDRDTREFMEEGFGHDFSRVRVHTDVKAAESTRAVNARAYTVGRDVVFGTGQYIPQTYFGNRLLAHELVHIIQQQPLSINDREALKIDNTTSSDEVLAKRVGEQVALGHSATVQRGTHSLIQRQEHGTYVSDLGPRDYLDAGFNYYRSWGFPNVRRVSNMADILANLNRSRRAIERFRIVSHAGEAGLSLGFLPSIEPDWFGAAAAQYTTPQRFRSHFILIERVNNDLFRRLLQVLHNDATTGPLMVAIGAGPDQQIPAYSELDIMLHAILENYWLRTVQLDTGGFPSFRDRRVLEEFDTRRLNTYRRIVARNAGRGIPREIRRIEGCITRLVGEVPRAVQRAGNRVRIDPITQEDAENMANPLTDPQARRPRLRSDITTAIEEGADGRNLRRLANVRTKINENTHIEIRGCNIGRNAALLDTLRGYFGSPGHLPSISAPDLYQYFFQLGYETYPRSEAAEQALEAAWNDPVTGLAGSYEDYRRRQAQEMLRTATRTSLAAFIQRYGIPLDEHRIQQLNPEIANPANIPAGTAVWLVARTSVAAGRFQRLEDFCREYIGNQYAWPHVWSANPGIRDPAGLRPHDQIQIPAHLLSPPVASAATELVEFRTGIRRGQAFVHVDPHVHQPIARIDDRRRAASVADWLARQQFDPSGRPAEILSAQYRRNFRVAMRNTWVQFLSRTYPNIQDPIFPEDPRYNAHIIRRP